LEDVTAALHVPPKSLDGRKGAEWPTNRALASGNHRYGIRIGRSRAERTRVLIGLPASSYPKQQLTLGELGQLGINTAAPAERATPDAPDDDTQRATVQATSPADAAYPLTSELALQQ
jgi:hypothetical protein